MSATVKVSPVYANGPTGDLLVTVTSDEFGDSLTGYIDAAEVLRSAYRAIPQAPIDQEKLKGMVDLVLEQNGTPRHKLFEYPHRDDDSRAMIAAAENLVRTILRIGEAAA